MKAIKKINRKWLFSLLLLFLASACVEKYWPEINPDGIDYLVVEGKISNQAGPYTIILSSTSSILDTTFIPKSGARITLLDDRGNQEILQETNPGYYKTASAGMQGIIGNSYKIQIELSDGRVYETEYETLLAPIPVESVSYKQEWSIAQNVLETDLEGFRFYANVEENTPANTYFYWEVEETYEYHSTYRIKYIYDGTLESLGAENRFGILDMKNQDSLYYCWKTQILNENLNYSLENLSSQESHLFPLHFIPLNSERLQFGYNMLLKQHVISKQAYTFLKNLKNQNENQGTLFTSQPFQIQGNVYNSNDNTEIVLGYFMVASASYGPRLQVRAPTGLMYEKQICFYQSSDDAIHHRVSTSIPENWPIYFTDYEFELPGNPPTITYIFAYVAPDCLDCTRAGGTIKKPSFWQDWYKNLNNE